MRLAKMSDATSVAGVTVRAVTDENIELARAVTDKNGIAAVRKGLDSSQDRMIPKRRTRICSLRIQQRARRCNLSTAHRIHQEVTTPALGRRPQVEIITDRNLYRPEPDREDQRIGARYE